MTLSTSHSNAPTASETSVVRPTYLSNCCGAPMDDYGRCTDCHDNCDMDDSSDDDMDTDARHEDEWESQTYEHYSGDHT